MKSKIKAFLLDDEPAVASVLENLLRRYAPDLEVVGIGHDWQASVEQVRQIKPDVVFLDVKMQGGTGFDFLKAIGTDRNFQVVFVTGYEDYAIQAIKAEALDYLLKPIDPEELVAACERISERLANRSPLGKEAKQAGYFMISAMEKKIKVPYMDIAYAQASSNYTLLLLITGEKFMLAKTLKDVESNLEETGLFLRANRDVLVNVAEVKGYSIHHPFEITLRNGTRLPISRRKKAEVIQRLEALGL
jgi:two-component system LytT family response regulator